MAHVVIKTLAGDWPAGGQCSTVTINGFAQPLVCSTTSGALVCEECKAGWCGHISSCMIDRQDAEFIHHNFMNYHVDELLVPVVPTRRVFASVKIAPGRNDGVYRVWLNEPRGDPGREFLGLISHEEGRIQIRQMIFQVLLPMMIDPPTHVRCNSMAHNLARAKGVSDVFASARSWGEEEKAVAIAHIWALNFYGRCLFCLTENGPSDSFDADLIPGR